MNGIGFGGAATNIMLYQMVSKKQEEERKKKAELQRGQAIQQQLNRSMPHSQPQMIPYILPPIKTSQPAFKGAFTSMWLTSQINHSAKKQQAQIDALQKQQEVILQQQQFILRALGYTYLPVIQQNSLRLPQTSPRFGDLNTATTRLICDIRHEREMKQQEKQVRQEARQELIQELQQKGYLSPLIPAQMFLNQLSAPTTPSRRQSPEQH